MGRQTAENKYINAKFISLSMALMPVIFTRQAGWYNIISILPGILTNVITADNHGIATLSTLVPAKACGKVDMQAIDLPTCAKTNVVRIQ